MLLDPIFLRRENCGDSRTFKADIIGLLNICMDFSGSRPKTVFSWGDKIGEGLVRR